MPYHGPLRVSQLGVGSKLRSGSLAVVNGIVNLEICKWRNGCANSTRILLQKLRKLIVAGIAGNLAETGNKSEASQLKPLLGIPDTVHVL
jgi:hypothetical protein